MFPSFAVFALCCVGALPSEAQSVIPVPAEMKLTEGAFAVAPGVAVFCNLQGVERERLAAYATSQPLLRACAETDDASAAGILLGIPLGIALDRFLILSITSMPLEVMVTPKAIGLSCGVTMLFALGVNVVIGRKMREIDMLGALKSVE